MLLVLGIFSSSLLGFVLAFVFKIDIFKEEPLPAWVEKLQQDYTKKELQP